MALFSAGVGRRGRYSGADGLHQWLRGDSALRA